MFGDTKICRDCIHSCILGLSTGYLEPHHFFCDRIKGTEPTIDIITGAVKTRGYLKCLTERANDNGCGLDGKYYQAR
jgi:hypothetical protein